MQNEKTLEELAQEERLSYFREWRAKNKDRVKENNRRYWEKKALERQRQQHESEEKSRDQQQ